MPPKKAKKGKGKPDQEKPAKEEKSINVTEVDKLQYEYSLLSLDNKIKRIEEKLNETRLKRFENENKIEEIQKDKKRVISYLNEKLKKKTDEAADLAETLEGSKQEFDSNIRQLLDEIETEANLHKEKQNAFNAEIEAYKEEIKSLIHFQEVKGEVLSEEEKLAKKVEKQRIEYENQNELLAARERQALLRLKKDMIRRVNESASDFRKSSDEQVQPTIKKALRENEQFKLALKKLEVNRYDIDNETNDYGKKLEKAMLKHKSLAETEMELAHQSHAKGVIISQLKAKVKEANAELVELELKELEIEQKGKILSELKIDHQNQNQEIIYYEKQKIEIIAEIENLGNSLVEKSESVQKFRSVLSKCAENLLRNNHLSRETVEELMEVMHETFNIDEQNLKAKVGEIEPIGL